MKKTVYAIMIIAAAVLCGCKKVKPEAGIGTLQFKVATASGDYITKSTNTDIKEFVVTITRPADGWTREYPRYADMPQNIELSSGAYTVTASSLYKLDAAWDQPIYSGTAEFTIAAGEMTPVSLVCTLSNMKVTIVPSTNFAKEMELFNVVVTNAGDWTEAVDGDNALTWDNEKIERGDAGYFTVAPLLVKVYGKRAIDQTEASSMKTISTVAARDHHIINLDARVTGEAQFELIIDDQVVEKNDDIYVDGWAETPVDGGEQGGDDPGSGDDPGPDNPSGALPLPSPTRRPVLVSMPSPFCRGPAVGRSPVPGLPSVVPSFISLLLSPVLSFRRFVVSCFFDPAAVCSHHCVPVAFRLTQQYQQE